MDLSLKIEDTTLYIRVAALIRGEKGFIFEKSNKGYFFTVGGKVKLNESSTEAIKREVKEELDIESDNYKIRAVLENFYTNNNGEKIHEICFVYELIGMYKIDTRENFIEILPEEIDIFDLRPLPIKNLLRNKDKDFIHITIK